MGTDDLALSSSPCDENTSGQSILGAGLPALSDAIALRQHKFEQLLANQQLWSQQFALEQEAKIKSAAEQVKKQVLDLTKMLKGEDDATRNLGAQESFHARHVHDLSQPSKSLLDVSKSECKLSYPDKFKKENEVSLPKFKDHHRSSSLSSERYRKESGHHEEKGRGRRSRSRDKIRDRSQDERSRSRVRAVDTHRERTWSRNRSKERGRCTFKRSRSRSRGGSVDRHRERRRSREKSGSRRRVEALYGQHREKTSKNNNDDTSHDSKSHEPSRISGKCILSTNPDADVGCLLSTDDVVGHSSAYRLKDSDVTNTFKSKDETGTEEQKRKHGKQIKNDKSIGETRPNRVLIRESPGNSAPVCRNYQTAARDGRSLAIAKRSANMNVDSTAPTPHSSGPSESN